VSVRLHIDQRLVDFESVSSELILCLMKVFKCWGSIIFSCLMLLCIVMETCEYKTWDRIWPDLDPSWIWHLCNLSDVETGNNVIQCLFIQDYRITCTSSLSHQRVASHSLLLCSMHVDGCCAFCSPTDDGCVRWVFSAHSMCSILLTFTFHVFSTVVDLAGQGGP